MAHLNDGWMVIEVFSLSINVSMMNDVNWKRFVWKLD